MSFGNMMNQITSTVSTTFGMVERGVKVVDRLVITADNWAAIAQEASDEALDAARIQRQRNTLILEAELAELGLTEVPVPKRSIRKIAATPTKEVK